ncbi:MAG TPA: hypothetical protein VIA45_06255 [Thermoanaerobaculia bacterium]
MRTLVGVVLLSCAAAGARAGDGPLIAVPAAGERVAAGDTVRVRWGEVSIGGNVEEQELLLSLDGGRHFRLVTRRLDPSAREYRWIVPQLPSGEAVLALRVGDERGEVLAGKSAAFTIESGAAGAGLSEPAAASEETWAPLPDGWEGPVALRERSFRTAWTQARHRRAEGVVSTREAVVDPTKIATFLESPRRPCAASVTEQPQARSPDYPRRP